jgi:hypothetical protein
MGNYDNPTSKVKKILDSDLLIGAQFCATLGQNTCKFPQIDQTKRN